MAIQIQKIRLSPQQNSRIGGAHVSHPFEQSAQIEVGVGKVGSQPDCALVVRHRFLAMVLIFEREGEVVVGDRVIRTVSESMVIEARGLARVAILMHEAAEVDAGTDRDFIALFLDFL